MYKSFAAVETCGPESEKSGLADEVSVPEASVLGIDLAQVPPLERLLAVDQQQVLVAVLVVRLAPLPPSEGNPFATGRPRPLGVCLYVRA